MMLGYEKELLRVQAKTEVVRYNGFTVEENGGEWAKSEKSGSLVATESVNCELGDGVLRTGVGIVPYLFDGDVPLSGAAELPEADVYFTLLKKEADGGYSEKLGYIAPAGTVFVYDEATNKMTSRYAFGARMKPVPVIDSAETTGVAFAGEAGVYVYTEDGGMTATAVTKAVAAACVFKNRLFCAAEPFTIAYSAPLQPTEFGESIEDGGRIVFPSGAGKIVALVPFDGSVFVFYEYGISRLDAAGSARDFKLESVGYGGGKIFGDSVGVCSVGGEKAFFLASDGLYVFDGSRVERVCENLKIRPICEGQVCGHAEFDGKYFVRFIDEDGEKRGVVVDAAKEIGYRAFVPKGLSTCRGKGVCFADSKLRWIEAGGSLPAGYDYTFVVEKTNFGAAGIKTLKTLRFFGEGQLLVKVSNGRRAKTVKAKFENGEARVRVWLKGEAFSLQLTLSDKTSVRAMTAETVRCSGVKDGGLTGELGRRREA